MVWQMWDLKQLFAYPGCDAGIRSMALSYDQRLEQSLVFTRISDNICLQLDCIFAFLLILIFCGSQILVIILRILRLHKFLPNMSYLGQIIFFRISALRGMKRDSRNLTLADFQGCLSYWPVPMYSVGHTEVEGYICAFHVSSFTYDTNHIPNSRPLR